MGLDDYWAVKLSGFLADLLSGFSATPVALSYNYDGSFSEGKEFDKCQREDESTFWIGSESHAVGGEVAGWHPNVPGGYHISISVFVTELLWEKKATYTNNVVSQTIRMKGKIQSFIVLGDKEPRPVEHFTQADITTPSDSPYFTNGNYGIFD